MAVRDDFTAGEVLAAADLNDTFAQKLPYSYGTATPSTTDSGFLWYDSNSTPAEVKFWDGAAFQALTSGKILQVVRATDTTDRSSTSQTYVDVSGMSVTITPQKSDSAVLIEAFGYFEMTRTTSDSIAAFIQITDSSNNAISGAEELKYNASLTTTGLSYAFSIRAYATPATTSAVTYKMRYKVSGNNQTVAINNSVTTGQMYAIEVSA